MQDARYCLHDLERSAEHDDSALWATCGELLVRLWPVACGGADATEQQVCASLNVYLISARVSRSVWRRAKSMRATI